MTGRAERTESVSRFAHRMICWNCGGSGVMADENKRCVPCDVCGHVYGEIEVVPRSVADNLAEALEAITRDDCMLSRGETGSWIDTEAPARIAEAALAEYRAVYPREETTP